MTDKNSVRNHLQHVISAEVSQKLLKHEAPFIESELVQEVAKQLLKFGVPMHDKRFVP